MIALTAIQLTVLFVLYGLSIDAESEVASEARERKILGKSDMLTKACLTDLPESLESYVFGTSDTAKATGLETYYKSKKTIEKEINWLEQNIEDPQEKLMVVNLAQSIHEGLKITDGIRDLVESQGSSATHEAEERSKQLGPIVETIRLQLRDLSALRANVSEDESFRRHMELRDKQRVTIMAACLVTVLAAVSCVIVFLRTIIGRINIIVDNTTRLSENKPLNDRLSGSDEIAELDRSFHRMSSKLLASQGKERAIFDKARDVICTLDHNLCFSSANQSCLRILDRRPEDLMGTPFIDIVNSRHQREITSQLVSLTTDRSKADIDFEAQMLKGDGSTLIHMIWSGHWSEVDGSVYLVGHDITDRKKIEELIREKEKFVRQLIEVMPVGIIRANRAGTIEFANPALEKVLNYESSEVVGQNLGMIFDPTGDINYGDIRKLATNKLVETTARKKNGDKVDVEFSIESFDTESGPRDLAIFFDVTEKQEVRRLRNQFVAMITHELRSPLTAIRGYLSLLSTGVFGEIPNKAEKGAIQAENNVDRLINLINDLLDLEKLEAGKMDMNLETTDLATVFEKSVDAVNTLAEAKSVKISCVETDLEILGDESRLIQVMVNLLSNAVKYSPSGQPVKITVEDKEDCVKVNVIDRGQGIPKDYLDSIFERFQQARGHKEGTGLGLAISKAIVESHCGKIGVDSTTGEGSTFWFTLMHAPNRQPD